MAESLSGNPRLYLNIALITIKMSKTVRKSRVESLVKNDEGCAERSK